MKWHDYPTLLKSMAARLNLGDLTPRQMFSSIRPTLTGWQGSGNTLGQLFGEMKWLENDRPYYDLYPSVAEAFIRVNLDNLTCENIQLPLKQLLVRCPVGQELKLSPSFKLRSLLAIELEPNEAQPYPALIVCLNDGSTLYKLAVHTLNAAIMVPGTTIASRLALGRAKPYSQDKIDNEAVDNALKLVCTLSLIKDDPDIIEPLPLEKDLQKWNSSHDFNLIEKAHRRGKRGWAIGKRIEVSPGFRNPHFAIRWCGKGRIDPRLRPVKGCFVNRKKIEEVPTDWLGPE